MNRLDQSDRNKNVEIDNVELLEGEKTEDVVMKIAKAIKINLDIQDIEAVRRLPVRKSSAAPPRIIVQFSSSKKRDEFIAARSQLAHYTSGRIVGGKSKDRVYINENLTAFNRELLWKTKQKGKAEGFKFIWFKFGKVLAKKNENSPGVIHISTFADIDKLASG